MIRRPLLVRLPTAFLLVPLILLLWYIYRRSYEPTLSATGAKSLSGAASSPACPYPHSVFPLKRDVTEYSRGAIRRQFGGQADPDLFEFNGTFLESFDILSGHAIPHTGDLRGIDSCAEIDVATATVAVDPPVEMTAPILIGVATRVKRIEEKWESLYSELANTNASLVALVEDRDDLTKIQKSMRNRGLDVTLYPTVLDFKLSYFSLVQTFTEHIQNHRPDTKWVIWSDDDTYIPALRLLGQKLSTLDASANHYIGTLSEKSRHLRDFGRWAYGGGGIILSRPAVEAMHKQYDFCMGPAVLPEDRQIFGGDKHLAMCLKAVMPDVNLTVWPELRQFDVHGNPAGIYEDGHRILSFHHWTPGSWAEAPVVQMAKVRAITGEASIRHRYIFDSKHSSHSNVSAVDTFRSYYVLTNGYSIVQYDLQPRTPDIDFKAREATWSEATNENQLDDYQEQLAPLRDMVVEGIWKKRYILTDVKTVDGNVHQLYVWKRPVKRKFPVKDKKDLRKDPRQTEQIDITSEHWIEIIWLTR